MRRAFTLAEVLITLAIIGIVAAITIPSVIANYQQQEFKTGLRKAVSVLNEAIQANIAFDGETPYDRGIEDWHNKANHGHALTHYLTRHMSVIKNHEGGTTGEFASENGLNQIMVQNEAFYTNDGMRFEITRGKAVLDKNPNLKLHESGLIIWSLAYSGGQDFTPCGSYGLAYNPNNTKTPPCFIIVDVNGDRKPTIYGSNVTKMNESGAIKRNYVYPAPTDKRVTDIFPILITDEKAIPFGVVAQRAMYDK